MMLRPNILASRLRRDYPQRLALPSTSLGRFWPWGPLGMGFSEQDWKGQEDHKPCKCQERHPIGVAGGELIPYDLCPINHPNQGGCNGAAVAETVHVELYPCARRPSTPAGFRYHLIRNFWDQSRSTTFWAGLKLIFDGRRT